MESCQNAGTRVTRRVHNTFEAVFPMRLDLKPIKHNLYLFADQLHRTHCEDCDKLPEYIPF